MYGTPPTVAPATVTTVVKGLATGAAASNAVGTITASAQHFELGPIALAIVKRSTPVDVELVVASEGLLIPAAQEVIVPPAPGSTPLAARDPRVLWQIALAVSLLLNALLVYWLLFLPR